MIRFILRSIIHYRRVSLAMMLSVALATAVVGGSLIVGDSVRTSLKNMTLDRLGQLSHVVHGPQFFRQALAEDFAGRVADEYESLHCSPALLLTGSLEAADADGTLHRSGQAVITGLNSDGYGLLQTGDTEAPSGDEIILGYRAAEDLQVVPGDTVTLRIERPAAVPRDSLLGNRDNTTAEVTLTVRAVLGQEVGASRFSMVPNQQFPANAFLSLDRLQQILDLDALEAGRRRAVARPARVNTIFVGDSGPVPETADDLQLEVDRNANLNQLLDELAEADDIGLKVRTDDQGGWLSLESRQMIVPEPVRNAAHDAAADLGMVASDALVYLVNQVSATDEEQPRDRYSMYSIACGLPAPLPPPLGPLLVDGSPITELQSDEVLLSHWLAADLQVSEGDPVYLRWHAPESHGDGTELTGSFCVRGVLPEDDPVTASRTLTPEVPGITDVDSFDDWDQPFEMDTDRLTDRDDDYWSAYRATPKLFLSLEKADELWGSRFGKVTSVRLAATNGSIPADRRDGVRRRLIERTMLALDVSQVGIASQPIRATGLMASAGANDFSQLFLGFSMFVIGSSLLLALLMFRLGLASRIQQLGLMQAVGIPDEKARRIFLGEAAIVLFAGAALGALSAAYLGRTLIDGLTTIWSDAVGTQFLQADVRPSRPVAAAVGIFIAALTMMLLSLRRQRRFSVVELLRGESDESTPDAVRRSGALRLVILCASAMIALAGPGLDIAGALPGREAFGGLSWRVVVFFVSGLSALTFSIVLLKVRLLRSAKSAVRSLSGLAFANAGRAASRSLLTVALIASAAFLVVAVAAGRRNPVQETPQRDNGTGGYWLIAEASQPVLHDLATEDGRLAAGLDLTEETTLPEGTMMYPFSVRPGQDASCLNLYQTQLPTLLGADSEFLNRGGFRFADTGGENPWLLLKDDLPPEKDLPVIPVIGDLNTLQFSLKKGLGDRILFPDEQTPRAYLQVVGMLDSSIFQGVLVLADDKLTAIAPEVTGSRYFLVDFESTANGAGDPLPAGSDVGSRAADAESALETGLAEFGVEAETTNRRLADFLAVQNTYLTTFLMLGGLGLIIGTIGTSVVMLRNVLERRREIALLQALGFTRQRIASLIVLENLQLLLWGILSGAGAALLAMLPHLLSTGADVPWLRLAITMGIVLATGLVGSVVAVRAATRISVKEALADDAA